MQTQPEVFWGVIPMPHDPFPKVVVRPTVKRAEVEPMTSYLKSEWCACKESEFLCYPEDGECTCGVVKHHVHCKHCGGISQIG